MNFNDYLLRGVKPEEYQELKNFEKDIVNSVIEGFNDVFKPKVQGMKTTFNAERIPLVFD